MPVRLGLRRLAERIYFPSPNLPILDPLFHGCDNLTGLTSQVCTTLQLFVQVDRLCGL